MTAPRRAAVVLLAVALAAVTLTGTAGAAPAPLLAADDGAAVTTQNWIDDRAVDLVIRSPALGGSASVRLLLPVGWKDQPARTWPQSWLLHGCCEDLDYRSWDSYTDVRAFTADKPVIVVMPSDGQAGFYTRWWNHGLGGPPDWETFHMTEVRQIVERNFRTNDRRAVAGLSIGGYGAVEYASSHPGVFGAAASYSGMPNTQQTFMPQVVQFILARTGTFDVTRIWGSQVFQADIWTANKPYNRIEKLRGTRLYLSAGDGGTGPFDALGVTDRNIEPFALSSSTSFTDRLTQLGIPFTADYYRGGTHSWPYWQRALHESWATTLAPALWPAQ